MTQSLQNLGRSFVMSVILIGSCLTAVPASITAAAPAGLSAFYQMCVSPSTPEAGQETIRLVLYKLGLAWRLNDQNCAAAVDRLERIQHLNLFIYPGDIPFGPITDLKPIGAITHLEELTVSRHALETLAGIESLSRLRYLNAYGNQLRDISALAGLPRLAIVMLSDNELTSIEALAGKPRLEELSLANNQLTSADSLASSPWLLSLNLGQNQLTDLEFLSRMRRLQRLDVADNQVAAMPALSDLQSLQSLSVANNPLQPHGLRLDLLSPHLESLDLANTRIITDLGFAARLAKLRWLNLANNDLSEVDFTGLSELWDLEHLYMENSGVYSVPSEITHLLDEHPNSSGRWIKLKVRL